MKIVSPETLARFREPGLCELCGEFVCFPDPHHVFARGRGDAFRNDLSLNLLLLCRPCHAAAESGNPSRKQCLAIIAEREGLDVEQLELILKIMRNA